MKEIATVNIKYQKNRSKTLFRYILPLAAGLAVFGFSIKACKDEILNAKATDVSKTSQVSPKKAEEKKKAFKEFWKKRQEIRQKLAYFQEQETTEDFVDEPRGEEVAKEDTDKKTQLIDIIKNFSPVDTIRQELKIGGTNSMENFSFEFDGYRTNTIDIPQYMPKLDDGFYIKITNDFGVEYKIVKYNQPLKMVLESLDETPWYIKLPVQFERSVNDGSVMLVSSCKLSFSAGIFGSEETSGFYPNCDK